MRLHTFVVRHWRRRPGRTAATIASVAVAVGAVVGTWTAAEASRAGYRRLAEAAGGPPVVDVLARDGGRFDPRGLDRLVEVPGVRAVVPLLFRPTLLRAGGRRVHDVAVGVDAGPLVERGLLALSSGTVCRAADEIVLDESLAAALGRGVDDEVLVFASRIVRMRITGLATTDTLRRFSEGGGVLLDMRALQSLSPARGTVDRVRVVFAAGTAPAAALALVRPRLPAGLVAEVPAGAAGLGDDVMHAAYLGLDFIIGLTGAMAWLVVGNAMLMNVTERRRQLSLVRLLGAPARTVRRLVAGEAAVLGGIGAVTGAAVGIAAARPIAAGISRALESPPDALTAGWIVVVPAVAAGALLAVAAAWWPAREATKLDLLAGLAQAPDPAPHRTSGRQAAAVAISFAAAAGLLALVVVGRLPPRAAVVGGIAMLSSFVAATSVVLPPLARLLALVVPRRYRIETVLATAQILRRPVRTALTTGVLVVAVTNGVGLGHAIRDNVEDVQGWFVRALRADWLVMQAGVLSADRERARATSAAVEADVRALEGVERVEAIGLAHGRAAGTPCIVIARDVNPVGPLPVRPVDAAEPAVRAALARGEAVAGTVLARRAGIAAGDEVVVDVLGRSTRVRIAALAVDYTSGGGSLLLDRGAAARLLGVDAGDILLVTATTGRAGDLGGPLADLAAAHGLVVRSFVDYRRRVDRMVAGVVGSLWAMLGLGFVVGGLGVANTVTMNVLEQTRSLGLLRAVGMSGGQVRRVVLLESLLLGGAGCAIGLVGGLTTAAFIQFAGQPLLGHPLAFSLRPGLAAGALAAALAVTALAAWLPARRATRLDLAEAIAAE